MACPLPFCTFEAKAAVNTCVPPPLSLNFTAHVPPYVYYAQHPQKVKMLSGWLPSLDLHTLLSAVTSTLQSDTVNSSPETSKQSQLG